MVGGVVCVCARMGACVSACVCVHYCGFCVANSCGAFEDSVWANLCGGVWTCVFRQIVLKFPCTSEIMACLLLVQVGRKRLDADVG